MEVEYVFEEDTNEASKIHFHFSREFCTQFGILFVANLLIFISGTHIGWIGPTILKLSSNSSEIPLTSSEISWLTAMLPLGGGIGPIFGAVLANGVGRKNAILLTTIPEIASWIVIANAKNIYNLCIAQFIKGLIGGFAMAAVPMYLGEVSSPQFRGINGMLFQLHYTFGAIFEVVLVPFVSIAVNAWIASIIPFLLLIIFIWMPESPYYFLIKNQTENARKSLQILRQTDHVDQELEHLKQVVGEEQNEVQKFSEIFRVRNNRISFFLCFGIISTQLLTGMNVIFLYSQVILDKSSSPIEPHICGIIISVVGFICVISSFLTIDSLGRRPLLLFGTFGTMIPCFLIGLYFHLDSINYEHISSIKFVPFLALIVHHITVVPGITTVPYLYLSEMLSTSIKGFASLIICCYASIGHSIFSKFYVNLCDFIGMHNVFYLLVFGCFISGIGTYFFVPETKGKSLDEIQKYLKSYNLKQHC
ncbi:facilitated trehalose transporter Tret1-like [Chrysoperla carnea]|uniref:facilitated trehalose transporter Tret1-like n=1 Tax=Chrysoperla carnea TaxID=189513 RepID=UPI001D06ED21|nr:facilitated trehalose transporter Tret1-like [Chrysoperla carnea]